MYREGESAAPILVVACKGRVHGIDRETGEKRWEVVVTTEVDRYYGGLAVELLVTSDRVYAASWKSDDIVCIAYPGGEEIGRAKIGLEGSGRPTMLIDGDQLFVARDGQVASLTLAGARRWVQTLAGIDREVPTALGFPGNVRQGDDRRLKWLGAPRRGRTRPPAGRRRPPRARAPGARPAR